MKFACEVLLRDPSTVADATAALAAVGCKYETDHRLKDPAGMPYVWGMVSGTTELAENDVGTWVHEIVSRFDGEAVEWRYGAPWKIRE